MLGSFRNLHVSKRVIPVVITLFFISITFAYYYLVYVKKNEEQLIQQGFRVLGHTEKNLRALKKVFITHANDKSAIAFLPDSEFTSIDPCVDNQFKERIPFEKLKDKIEGDSIVVYQHNNKSNDAIENNIIRIDISCLIKYNFIKREDVFKDYVVFGTDDIYYKTYNNQLITNDLGNVFPYFRISDNLGSKDESDKESDITHLPNSIYTVTISNVSHQLMIHEISNFTSDGKSLFVGGLIPTDLFNAKRRSLPISYIIVAVILLILIILLTPILKLRIMGYFEHLHIGDVVSLGLSFTLGIAILFVLCLAFYTLIINNHVLNQRLSNLSHSLHDNFQKELNDFYKQIKQYDAGYHTITFDESDKIYHHTLVDVLSKDRLTKRPYPGFNGVFWTDVDGFVKKSLTPFNKSIEIKDLSTRAYIKNVINNELWNLGPDKKVALQSIVSYVDGTQELGMGICSSQPDDSIMVAAGSTQLHSVMSTILPPGYQLAVIDTNGEVWFHSQQNLNTNENFFDEINQDPVFKSAIRANIDQLTEVKYHGSSYRCSVEPIGNLPLYAVAIYNLKNHRTVLSQSLAISTIVFILFYILILLFMLIMIISNSKLSMIKQKQFFFNWLRPIEEKSMEFRYRYFAMMNMMTLTFTAVLLIYLDSFIMSLQLCFTVITLQILIQYESIHKVLPTVYNYFNNKRYYQGIVFVLLFIFFISNYYFFETNYNHISYWISIGTQLGMFYLCLQFIFKNKNPIIVGITSTFGKMNRQVYKSKGFKKIYLNFILSWSFLLGIMPALLIFMKVYTIEKTLYTKYELSEIAKAVPKESAKLAGVYGGVFNNDSVATHFIANKIKVNQYLDSLYFSYEAVDSFPYCKEEDSLENNLNFYITLKPFFNEIVLNSSGFIRNQSANDQWVVDNKAGIFTPFSKDNDVILYFKNLTSNLKNDLIKVNIIDRFPLTNYWIGKPIYIVLFVVFLALVLIVYFKTLQYCLTMLFGWQFENYTKGGIKTKDDINLIINQSERSILISPLDYDKVIQDLTIKKEVIWTDLSNYPGIDSQAQEFIKDLDLHNITQKDFKLKLLAVKSMVEDDKRILVVSKAHPDRYYDHLKLQIESLSFVNNPTEEQKEKLIKLESELYTFQEVMSYFQIYYLPPDITSIKGVNGHIAAEFVAIPMLETNLKKSEFEVPDGSGLNLPYDQFILRLHQRAESLYGSIWNSLSLNEKQVVYDMAKDRFVNCKNTKSITRLLQKGIFIYDHSLRLCNESFTNFVVTNLRHNAVIREKLNKRKLGMWGMVQNVLVLVVIGIVVFIALGNQDLLHDVNALLVALTSILGLLIRFGGIFSSVPGNQENSG